MVSTSGAQATVAALAALYGELPFRASEAQLSGISRRQLAAVVAIGLARRIRRNVYVLVHAGASGPASSLVEDARALQLAIPDAVISHESAADLLGLHYDRRLRRVGEPEKVTVTIPHGSHLGRTGYRSVSARVPHQQRLIVGPLVVTSPARTAVDLARHSPFTRSLIVCDSAMRLLVLSNPRAANLPAREAVHSEELRSYAREALDLVARDMTRWPGIRPARVAIQAADPASESPLESVSRGQLLTAGLPKPQVGWPVIAADGHTYWGDLVWVDEKVIGEADGALKYETRDDLIREKIREDALRAAGWTVVRWTWHEAATDPQILLRKLARVL